MKCHHCTTGFHDSWQGYRIGSDTRYRWGIECTECSECNRFIIKLTGRMHSGSTVPYAAVDRIVYPKATARAPLSDDVPDPFKNDYTEACAVLADSAKASAALSRRCLQNLLREKASIKKGDLVDEIQQVIDSKQLRSDLSSSLNAVRQIGNFAAHPIKSKHTGEIVEVEPGEAEWSLDVLEDLFDFYFVRPGVTKKKKDALNKKLQEAGKPPLK